MRDRLASQAWYKWYALTLLTFLNLWCAFHYYMAGRTLREDQAAQRGTG